MEKKITKKDKFTKLLAIPAVAEDALLVEFINNELALLEKKTANRKPAKKSDEFLALKQTVANALTDEPMTVSEIIKSSDALTGMNTQKLVPVLKELVLDGVANRIEEKGKALFVAVPFEDTEDTAEE